MSVQGILVDAVVRALNDHAPLRDAVTAVFDVPPVRAAVPHVVVEEPVLVDWGTKDMAGREGRITVVIQDAGERPTRLRTLAGAAEDALTAIDPALGAGWRVVTIALVRSRIVRGRDSGWVATSEFRVRMLKES